MSITATIAKQPHSSIKLDIAIAADDVTTAFAETYAELAKKIKVKGFRPGKVPASVIKMKYGTSVTHEVLDHLLNKAFRQAIKDNDLHPVNHGSIDGELPELAEDKPFSFSMLVDVYPEFTLPEYLELPVTKDQYEIRDKDIQSELEHLAERFATIEDIPAAVVEKDSLVKLDYQVEFKGAVVENLSRQDQSYDQDKGAAYPNLKKGLLGLKAGDSTDIKSSLPKEFPNKDMAGKDVVFKVTVKSVQKRVLPALDDEFAKKVSQEETLDAFRETLRKNMEEHARRRESRNVQSAILEQLGKAVTIDIPASMIEAEINSLIANLKNDLLYARMTFEQYLEESGKTEAQLREELAEPARKQTTTLLLLSAIAKKENIKAEEDEIREEVEQLARRYSASYEDAYKHLAEHGEIDSIAFGIRRRKTLEFLEEKAKIKKGKTLGFADLQSA